MILIIDNYDSFTYNLVQYVSEIEPDVVVKRNDAIRVEDILSMRPQAILFSPGPGIPSQAGNMETIIRSLYREIPMLGICLGHQAICEVFDADITHAKDMMHGESSTIHLIKKSAIFEDLPQQIQAGRYHSLIAQKIASPLQVTAISTEEEVMAVQHERYPVYGVQFHPESLLTPDGKQMLSNFIRRTKQC